MQPQGPSPAPHAGKGLPPVLPPSGTHIVKTFLVPLLIVGGLLGIWALVMWKFGGPRTPESYLVELRSDNLDRRWRAADDLAQRLPGDDWLASNPAFTLELVADLHQALGETREADAALAKKLKDEPQADVAQERKDLEEKRNYACYLASCVSGFCTPAGVGPLKRMALEGAGGPADVRAALRRWALWSLANLGQNLKRFDGLPAERQEAVIAGFEEQASAEGERGLWAKETAAYLKDRRAGRAPALGVDEVLVRCAEDGNPVLRLFAVFATNFWPGGDAVEEALLARLGDKGEGEDQIAALHEGAKNLVVEYRKNEGLGIRYQAAVALARRGSAQAPLDVLGEMLDESVQLEKHRVRSAKDGREAPDKVATYGDMENALKAIAELHRKNPRVNLAALDTAIDKLKRSDNPAVRKEAERTREALGK